MHLEALEILFQHKKYNKSHHMGLTVLWIHIFHGNYDMQALSSLVLVPE